MPKKFENACVAWDLLVQNAWDFGEIFEMLDVGYPWDVWVTF